MQLILKSSTQQPLVFGPILQSSDGRSFATGATLSVLISKAGGSFVSPAGALSEIGNGMYQVAGNATDTNTLGPLALVATGTGCVPYGKSYQIDNFDMLATAPNVTTTSVATNGISGASLNINAVSVLGGQILSTTATTSPATASAYVPYYSTPMYNGRPVFWGAGGVYFIWWDSTNTRYVLSTVVGTPGTAYWTASTLLVTWTPQGTATGSPSFSANFAVSPNLPFLVINSSGSIQSDLYSILGTAITGTAAYLAASFSTFFNVNGSVLTTASVNQGGDAYGVANSRLPTALTANGNMKSSLVEILTTALTETTGYLAVGFKKFFNVATPTSTMNEITLVDTSTNLSNAGPDTAGTTALLARLTLARAGYLDNLNVGGLVASNADVLSINQSAAKHLLLVTVQQYCPGEAYTIECRTYKASDGSSLNADSTPTLTATGSISGSLSSNLSAATNPSAGLYRWTYRVPSNPTLEQIQIDVSATISGATFTLSTYCQTVDEATTVFTATNQAHLEAIYNKLPANGIADETLLISAIGTPAQASTLASDQTALLAAIGSPSQASVLASDQTALLAAIGTPLQAGSYVAPHNGNIDAIYNKLPAGNIADEALVIAAAGTDTPGTTTLLTRLSLVRAGYLDNLNVGGPVASHSDLTSGSVIVTVGSFTTGGLLAMRNKFTGVVTTISGPVRDNGASGLTMLLTIGDDYSAADSRSADFDLDGTILPDLTTWTVELVCELGGPKRRQVVISGEIIAPTGTTRTVRFEPTSGDTFQLMPTCDGEFYVRLTSTTTPARTITPAESRGQLIVLIGKRLCEQPPGECP